MSLVQHTTQILHTVYAHHFNISGSITYTPIYIIHNLYTLHIYLHKPLNISCLKYTYATNNIFLAISNTFDNTFHYIVAKTIWYCHKTISFNMHTLHNLHLLCDVNSTFDTIYTTNNILLWHIAYPQ
jgi:hypothetical protein